MKNKKDSTSPNISELQNSLLIMNAISNHIFQLINNFPMTSAKQNDDLKFILNSSLVLELCKFLEEFGYLGRQLRSCGKEWILRVLAPLYRPIK